MNLLQLTRSDSAPATDRTSIYVMADAISHFHTERDWRPDAPFPKCTVVEMRSGKNFRVIEDASVIEEMLTSLDSNIQTYVERSVGARA